MRIKPFLLLSALFALTFSVTGCDSEEENVSPTVSFSKPGVISVTSLGGAQSFNYKIKDRVSGGEITATSDADWISGVKVEPTSGTITFAVATNYEGERMGKIDIYYSLDNQELFSSEVSVNQEACVFSHDLKGNYSSGYWIPVYETAHIYSMNISDKGYTDQGLWQTEAIYYNFTICAEPPTDLYNIKLKPGVYPMVEKQAVGTADKNSARYVKTGKEIIDSDQRSFESGSITIEKAGEDGYTVTLIGLDNKGEFHRATYTGPVVVDGLKKVPSIEQDEIFIATSADAYFGVGDKEKMHCVLDLSQSEMSDWGFPMLKRTLSFEIFFKYDKDGRPTTGVYPFTVPDPSGLIFGEAGTIFPGRPSSIATDPTAARGTRIILYNDEGVVDKIGLLTDGTLTIEEAGEGNYHITCDLKTDDGKYKVQATYDGPLTIRNVPGRISTLTDDYTLNLSNALAQGKYYGDVYGNGCTAYTINLNPYDGKTGDGFMVEFVSKSFANFNEPIPDGILTAAPEDQTARPGQFTQGAINFGNGQIIGTAFVGAYAGGGMVATVAPATEGEFFIKHVSGETYHLRFDFMDDRGHRWNGEWESVIPLTDAGMNVFPLKSNMYKIK